MLRSEEKKYYALHTISAIGIAIGVWAQRLRFPFDDTFISFRYAEHLAAGHGLVWNVGGAHTEGYTNFLYILLLAALRFVTHDLLLASQVVGILCTIATGVLLHATGNSLRNARTGLLAALLYYWTPLTWINAVSGMETSLFVLLITLSLYYLSRQNSSSAFFAAFLATLTRPEASILALIILIWKVTDRAAWKSITYYFIAPCLLYATWKYWYFGDLLPNSFYIKVLGSQSHVPGLQYVRLWLTSMAVLLVVSIGIRNFKSEVLRAGIAWYLFLVVFYIFVLPLEGLYDRFLWPAFMPLCLTAAVGLTDVPFKLPPRIRDIAALAVLAIHITLTVLSPRTRQSMDAHEDVWDKTMDGIVTELRMMPQMSSITLAYGDAGYVVYESKIRHLDLVGLNDTRIAHARSREIKADVFRAERPDLLVIPIQQTDSCYRPIEDAYGVARDTNYHAVARVDVFPYSLAFFLDRTSSHYPSLQAHIVQRLNTTGALLKPIGCISFDTAYRTRYTR